MNYLKCLLTILLVVLTGCAKEEIDTIVSQNEIETKNRLLIQETNGPDPIRSKNELIIEYSRKVNDDIKDNLRKRFNVSGYRSCNCSNTRIELWEFKGDIDIEGRKDEITEEGIGVEGTDFQFYYPASNNSQQLPSSNQNYDLINHFVSTNRARVKIAVLDTGVALGALKDEMPFLYNSGDNSTSCVENEEEKEISGWDFVNNDNDVFDDNGHGTIVTSIIRSKLHEEGIDNYQILPVKVFDHLGNGSTFTILCGYLYATEKKDISIINFSFGWYGSPNQLFSKFISENTNIIHISSAGNTSSNNNEVEHYPSSYNLNNNLAIGSSNEKVYDIADFSNFGTSSVDFLSLGENILFEDSYGNSSHVSGTSFAAPLVTALSAKHYVNGYMSPSQITNQLYNNAKLIDVKLPIKFNDRIIN